MSNAVLECDGRDALDLMFKKMYPNQNSFSIITPSRCTRPSVENNDGILTEIIQKKMETKAMPISMRKRLMYEQSLGL